MWHAVPQRKDHPGKHLRGGFGGHNQDAVWAAAQPGASRRLKASRARAHLGQALHSVARAHRLRLDGLRARGSTTKAGMGQWAATGSRAVHGQTPPPGWPAGE